MYSIILYSMGPFFNIIPHLTAIYSFKIIAFSLTPILLYFNFGVTVNVYFICFYLESSLFYSFSTCQRLVINGFPRFGIISLIFCIIYNPWRLCSDRLIYFHLGVLHFLTFLLLQNIWMWCFVLLISSPRSTEYTFVEREGNMRPSPLIAPSSKRRLLCEFAKWT